MCGEHHAAYEHTVDALQADGVPLAHRPTPAAPLAAAEIDDDPDALPSTGLALPKKGRDKGKRRETLAELLEREEAFARHYDTVRDLEDQVPPAEARWRGAGSPSLDGLGAPATTDELELTRAVRSLTVADQLYADLRKRHRDRVTDKFARPAVAVAPC
jgi:hypothetical protein